MKWEKRFLNKIIRPGFITEEYGIWEKDGLNYYSNKNGPTSYDKKNLVNGTCELYHQNGEVRVIQNYVDGKREGCWKVFHENGQLEYITHFKDGKENGSHEGYYEQGGLLIKGNFKDGKRHGRWEDFYDDGELRERANYVDGKLVE